MVFCLERYLEGCKEMEVPVENSSICWKTR